MQNDYSVISIARFIENSEERSSDLQKLINTFGCPQNSDVEHFLHFNAIDFSRRKMSGTHLVCNSNAEIVGYFSLAMKPIVFHAETMSGTSKKKIERIAKQLGITPPNDLLDGVHALDYTAKCCSRVWAQSPSTKWSSLTGRYSKPRYLVSCRAANW